MFAWLAAAFFLIAALINGGNLNPSSPWFSWQTLVCAGLMFAMVHAAGFGPDWRRRG